MGYVVRVVALWPLSRSRTIFQDYFTHLECADPKLAHYTGYIIGNHILPWLEPGYQEEYCQTMVFTAEAEKYMGFLPL